MQCQAPRPPPFVPVAPSTLCPPTLFASVTDPTLHRHGWQSPRARSDEQRLPSRKIPSRFRSLLRYDALLPTPALVQEPSPRARSANAVTAVTATPSPRPPEALVSLPSDDSAWDGGAISSKRTNLDELKWFQHRWLDKHGKNSHMKESREKMALLRKWFDSLDADGSGEVGLDELEDPLVSVGLARSRGEVQKLIDQVHKDGPGEVTFAEFLKMMTPEKPKRARHRQPLHEAKAKPRPPARPPIEPEAGPPPSSARRPGTGSRRQSLAKGRAPAPSSNPVVKLFEDMQSGKLGDLAIPFPVLITAYRRRMLLNAHMSDDPTARRLGTSVLQALESTRYDGAVDDDRQRSSFKTPPGMTPSAYLRSYISTAETRGPETTQLPAL